MKLILLALLPLLTLADTVKDREGSVRSDREELSPSSTTSSASASSIPTRSTSPDLSLANDQRATITKVLPNTPADLAWALHHLKDEDSLPLTIKSTPTSESLPFRDPRFRTTGVPNAPSKFVFNLTFPPRILD